MKRNIIIALGIAILAIVLSWYFLGTSESGSQQIAVPVKKGEFVISVTTTGELEARNSEQIYGPSGLRQIQVYQVKISKMVPDGTVVDSGDFVAELDKSEITNKIKDLESELEKLRSQYTKTRLDTSLTLRSARENLVNLQYAMEQKKIELKQSKYEPPATIRKLEIELEKQKRELKQARENYQLKLEKAAADMQEVTASLNQSQRKYQQMREVQKDFTVKAPQAGMVVYKRNWRGQKQGVGETLSAWDNVVATLPDLSEMISKTYVNEIDISKVKTGQEVRIGIDAFPDRNYTGKVTEVANMGQKMRNSNAKVFEVNILLNESDTILRPAMTTKNEIITDVVDDVLHLPLECIHSNDSVTYVYLADRAVKQQIEVGKSNENEIIVKAGLREGDEVLLTAPEEPETYELIPLKP
ncbi:MAG: efflux RND transporter periplasmic adaptor subunit [Bacteroidales bacterium]|nr:efflux RND transporter periplasmic adaptor subunit [Bacteroidales bacterium]